MRLCNAVCNQTVSAPHTQICGSSAGRNLFRPEGAHAPIHEKLMKEINSFGEFEVAPKKAMSVCGRKKQFVMIGPKRITRF